MIAFFIFLACTNNPAEKEIDVLLVYDQGLAAYKKGDFKGASQSFHEALKFDSESSELKNWLGLSMLRAGQYKDALRVYDQALSEHPGSGDLRYNRAAVLVALNRMSEAAADLMIMYNNGHSFPEEVGRDPDFLALQQDVTYGHLAPKPSIKTKVIQENLSGLLGELLFVEWSFVHFAPLKLFEPKMSPLIRLDRVVEDQVPGPNGSLQTRLLLNWRAIMAGASDTASISLVAGEAAGVLSSLTLNVQQLKERHFSDHEIDIVLPSQLNPLDKRLSIERLDNGWGLVIAPPTAVIEWNAKHAIELEFRVDQSVVWIGKLTTDVDKILGKVHIDRQLVETIQLPKVD